MNSEAIKIKLINEIFLIIISCNNNIEIKPQVIAYYAGDEKSIDEFDLKGVDQIIYSFMHLKGNKLAIDDKKDSLTLLNVINQKKKYPKLKVLVSLGGWGGCETCSDIFSSKKARTEFAISTADIIESFNADGIDLDWEYPGISGYPGHSYKPEDRENFTDLIIQLRKYMKKDHILSFAAGASNRFFENSIEWDKVMPLVNNVNLMTYDFYGSGSTKTGHHTALSSNEFQNRSAKSSIKALINLGVKKFLFLKFSKKIISKFLSSISHLLSAINFILLVNSSSFCFP